MRIRNLWVRSLGILAVASLLTSCGGTYHVRDSMELASSSKIFISDFSDDEYNIRDRLEFKFADLGYVVVKTADQADLTVNWRYTGGALDTNASIFIVDKQGSTVYSGEGTNPGFGTLLDKAGAIWGCFERALAGLKKK